MRPDGVVESVQTYASEMVNIGTVQWACVSAAVANELTSPLVLVNPGQDANLGRARWVLGRQEDFRMERAAYRGSASADLVASAYTRTLVGAVFRAHHDHRQVA